MEPPTIIYKTALAVFKDRQMLMVRTSKNPEVFYTLGGKIEPGESKLASLHREVKEEVGSEIEPGSINFLKEFQAPAYGRQNTLVNVRLYKGELTNQPTPNSEVVEVRYFDSSIDKRHLSALTELIFPWLKQEDLID